MDILIRKEPNGSIYLDKENACYFETLGMDKPPYNYTKITIADSFRDCEPSDFNDSLNFDIVKYNARKQNTLNSNRIFELKELLASTDYKAIKYAEGEMSAEDYLPIKEQRKLWRKEINELENTLN